MGFATLEVKRMGAKNEMAAHKTGLERKMSPPVQAHCFVVVTLLICFKLANCFPRLNYLMTTRSGGRFRQILTRFFLHRILILRELRQH